MSQQRALIIGGSVGGLFAALAGIVLTARLRSAEPIAATGYELDAIAATADDLVLLAAVGESVVTARYWQEPDPVDQALADPAVLNRLQEAGIDPTPGSSPQKAAAFIAAELAKWAPIIRASGAQID